MTSRVLTISVSKKRCIDHQVDGHRPMKEAEDKFEKLALGLVRRHSINNQVNLLPPESPIVILDTNAKEKGLDKNTDVWSSPSSATSKDRNMDSFDGFTIPIGGSTIKGGLQARARRVKDSSTPDKMSKNSTDHLKSRIKYNIDDSIQFEAESAHVQLNCCTVSTSQMNSSHDGEVGFRRTNFLTPFKDMGIFDLMANNKSPSQIGSRQEFLQKLRSVTARTKYNMVLVNKNLMANQLKLANLHFDRYLIRKYGWDPWRQLILEFKDLSLLVEPHYT